MRLRAPTTSTVHPLQVESGHQILLGDQKLAPTVSQSGHEVIGVVAYDDQCAVGRDRCAEPTGEVHHFAVGKVHDLRGHQVPTLC